MLIRDIIRHLERLVRIYRHGGAKTQANELALLAEGLLPHGNQPVQKFVAAAQATNRTPRPGRRSPRPEIAVDAGLVRSYLAELRSGFDSREKFESVVSQIKADSRIGKEALTEI